MKCDPASDIVGRFAHIVPKVQAFSTADGVVAMTVASGCMWVALRNGGIEIRDVHTGSLRYAFAPVARPAISTRICCLLTVHCPNTSMTQVWVGLSTGSIEVYHAEQRYLLRQMQKHMSCVYCLAECGGFVYSGSNDFQIAQWRVADGRLMRILSGHRNYVRCLYAEGEALVSGSDDRTIRIWDVSSGEMVKTGHFHSSTGGVSALCRVGVTIWSGDNTGTLAVWKLRECSALLVSQPHSGRITSLRRSGSRVYSGSADGTVCVFDIVDGSITQRLLDHANSRVTSIQCAVEVDRYTIWTGSADNTVRCWHHDEHVPMTTDRERFNDMRWYYATQQPFRKANEMLLEQQRELSEMLTLTHGSEEAVRAYLTETSEDRQSAAAKLFLLQGKLKHTLEAADEANTSRKMVERTLDAKRQALEVLRLMLQRTLAASQEAKAKGLVSHVPSVEVPGGQNIPGVSAITNYYSQFVGEPQSAAAPAPSVSGTTSQALQSSAKDVYGGYGPNPSSTTSIPVGTTLAPGVAVGTVAYGTAVVPPPPPAMIPTPAAPPATAAPLSNLGTSMGLSGQVGTSVLPSTLQGVAGTMSKPLNTSMSLASQSLPPSALVPPPPMAITLSSSPSGTVPAPPSASVPKAAPGTPPAPGTVSKSVTFISHQRRTSF